MNHLQQAIEFRQTYRQLICGGDLASIKAADPDFRTLCMQIDCIEEEAKELFQAIFTWISTSDSEESKVEKAHTIKELADLIYVCYQLAAFLTVDIDEALDRVHNSNMSKLDDDGQPIFNEHGKVMKGPNYKEPDLSDLV